MTTIVAKLLVGGLLMALCVIVHAFGLTAAFGWAKKVSSASEWEFWPSVRLIILLACWIIFLHLINIVMWAALYTWKQALPDFSSATYFSAVTYTTTGYGDLVLPKAWRLVGGIEALTGLLMCGWSTGFFFAIVSRMYTSPLKSPNANTSEHMGPPA